MARVTRDPAMGDDAVVENDTVVVDDTRRRNGTVRDNNMREDVRGEMRAAERTQFGGMKFGSAFFGWLTAAGMGIVLTALVAAIATLIGLATDVEEGVVVRASTLGVVGVILVGVVVFISYFAGGYVAGRMARFSGGVQGFAVWLWSLIAAAVVAGLGLLFGARFDILANLDAFPRIPIRPEELTLEGIITAVVLALLPLLAAVLGGMAGMRYHRRVDRAGLMTDEV